MSINTVSDGQGGYELTYANQTRSLLEYAADAGIKVEALFSGTSINATNRANHLARIEAIRRFNCSVPASHRFVGVHFDLEPWTTPEWNTDREAVALDLVTFYADARDMLQTWAPDLTLAADIPFWFPTTSDVTITFNGQTKNVHKHIQDQVDYVGVMSYRRYAQGSGSITELIEPEIDYAATISRQVYAGVSTSKNSDPATISFYGIPSDIFWQELRAVGDAYAANGAFSGVLIQSYDHMRDYLNDNPPYVVDDFERYTNNQVLADSASSTPWMRFGTAVAGNLIATTDPSRVIDGDVSATIALNWSEGNTASIRRNFETPVDLSDYLTVTVDIRSLNTETDTTVRLSIGDGTTTFTTALANALSLTGQTQQLEFVLSSDEMIRTSGSGSFAQVLANVRSLGFRFDNSSGQGTETINLDNVKWATHMPEPAASGLMTVLGPVALMHRRRRTLP